MKGQYFSFDAIIATVIMVIAFSSLISYWVGVQSVVDSRTANLQVEAIRVAESLFSPGSPTNWEISAQLAGIRQIGIANGFSNELSKPKIIKLKTHTSAPEGYLGVARLFRINADGSASPSSGYFISISDTQDLSSRYEIGAPPPSDATEVATAHRGGVLDSKPTTVKVTLWRK